MFIWHKIKQKKNKTNKKSLAVTAVCEVLWEKIKGCTCRGNGDGLRSSVGGFAYSTGWSAEFSGNSVLCGTGHCGRNLVNGVRCSSGISSFGACTAGEGAWERDGGRVCRQKLKKNKHILWRDRDNQTWQGFIGLCMIAVYPSMLRHARGYPTTKITQFIGFSPTFTKLTMQNCKKKTSVRIWVCSSH